MKTRAKGSTGTPSNESCGSNASTPSSSRRSATRMLPRGIFARSVKFSFRSIAGIDDPDDEIAPGVESFQGEMELRGRRHELECVHRRRTEADSFRLHVD